MSKMQISLLAIIALGLFVLLDTIFIITPKEQGLILQFGQFKRLHAEPGIYFKMPIVERLARFDRRVLDYDADAKEVPTIDQKQLVVDTLARFQIKEPLRFRNTVQDEEGFRVRLANIIESELRAVIGRVPLVRVLTEERAELMQEITRRVAEETKSFGVATLDVRVKRIDLPQDNSNAIFKRMRTQREQEARKIRAEGKKDAEFIKADADKEARVKIAEAERRADVVRGEGEGQAQAIYNDAYGRDPEFFDFYRSMKAYEIGLGSDTTTMVGPPDGSFFRFFDLEQGRNSDSKLGQKK